MPTRDRHRRHANAAKIQFIIYILQANRAKIYTKLAKTSKNTTLNHPFTFLQNVTPRTKRGDSADKNKHTKNVLAVKNIDVNFVFLARLSLYL